MAIEAGDTAAAALQSDAQARREALDTQRSLLLQAPAGSGKTTVLTARFLALLAVAEAPEQILAITFTRKAAAEMRRRLLQALQAPAGSAPRGLAPGLLRQVRERDAQRGWSLLDNPARLRIETIDALNSRLARALPVAARCAPDLTIAAAPQLLYERAARATLESAGNEPALQAAVELLFERLDNSWSRLQGLLADMLARRSHWLPRLLPVSGEDLAARVQRSLEALIRAQLSGACSQLPAELLAEGARIVAATSQTARPPPCADPQSLPTWQALCELALTRTGWRQRFDARQGLGPGTTAWRARAAAWVASLAECPEAQTLLRGVQCLPEARLSQAELIVLDALSVLLIRAAAQLQLVFAAGGKVDYAYIAGAARAALSEQGEPSDFALRTGEALRHILIDEFQDTSFEQVALLQALTAGWEPGDGRTLFVVGDPMQSIYQFREAEVGLFLRTRDSGIGALRLGALQLRRNFRSSAPLITWINHQFAQLFPAQDDVRRAAIAYLASVPAAAEAPAAAAGGDALRVDDAAPADDGLTADEGAPVGLHRFEPGDLAGEAQRVVQIVRETRAREPQASIAVLVASREHAAHIAAALRESGLRLRGVDLSALRERAVIRDLAALTRALLHGADRTAWLALLRAPWCAATLAQLEQLCPPDIDDYFELLQRRATDDALDEPLRERLARLCAALVPAVQGAERGLGLWQRVERCWLRLAGPAIHAGRSEQLDARRYLDALALHDEPGSLVGETLGALTGELYSVEPPQPLAVEILTMHGAKGLEWDVVILPGLGRCTAHDGDPLLHWIELPGSEDAGELLLAPIRAEEREAPTSLAAYIKRLRQERARLERLRLLYVAATRARRALHLLGALRPPRGARSGPLPASGSPLELLWPALGAAFLAVPCAARTAPVPGPEAGASRGLAALWRVPSDWRPPPPPAAPQPQRLRLGSRRDLEEAPEYRWVGAAARAVGIVVHAELQRLAREPPQEARAAEGYALWLAELGVEPHERAAAAARVTRALQRTLADERGRWLLYGPHREAHSEWRLTGLHEGRIVNVVVDRMLLDGQGQRWVVDFKTSEHQGGSIRQFIDSEVQRYRAQLARYAALARRLGPQPLRAALYFPLLGEFRPVPLE